MDKKIKFLSIFLAAQIALAGILFLWENRGTPMDSNETLLRLTSDDFDAVTVMEPGKTALLLRKKDTQWVLPDRWDFPVSPEKFIQTIEKLKELKAGWPLGDTASARKRCKVTEDSFEKKVVFRKGEKEKKTFYIGTSPEYRKVYLRPSDRDGVYSREFGSYDLSIVPGDWENKNYLHMDPATLSQIEIPGIRLVQKENGFQLADLKSGEESNPGEIESFVSQATHLGFTELMGSTVLPEYGFDSPEFELTFKTKTGTTVTYTFSKSKTGTDYFLKISLSAYVFKIDKFLGDPFRAATRKKFLKKG